MNDVDNLINTNLIPTESHDDSPDIFYYDVFGVKGKFIIARNKEIYCFPRNNIKFTFERIQIRVLSVLRSN